MAFSSSRAEGYSLSRPPLFDGTNYGYWKIRMKAFVQSTDYALWSVISDGPNFPKMLDVNGEQVDKPKEEWDDEDVNMIQRNCRAMHFLYCALDANVSILVFACKTAKEIWDKLEILYEGTSEVKEAKIDLLVAQYEQFKLKPDESIKEMFTRFTKIVNELKFLGKGYTAEEQVRKVLRSLPETWDAKVSVIKARNLKTLSIDELIGLLMFYENTAKPRYEDTKLKEEELHDSDDDD